MQQSPSSVKMLSNISKQSTSKPPYEHAISISLHDCDTFDGWKCNTNLRKKKYLKLWREILLSTVFSWSRSIFPVSELSDYHQHFVYTNFVPTNNRLNRMAVLQLMIFELDSYCIPDIKFKIEIWLKVKFLGFTYRYSCSSHITQLIFGKKKLQYCRITMRKCNEYYKNTKNSYLERENLWWVLHTRST